MTLCPVALAVGCRKCPVFAICPAKSLIAALTELQDVLGAHQDSVVAREVLHRIGPDSFQFGVLWARQEQVGRDTHAQLPVVVETSRKKKLRKWLG